MAGAPAYRFEPLRNRSRTSSSAVWPSTWCARGVPTALAAQEADKYSGHSLRHGFTATAAEAGANLPVIKAISGHKSDDRLPSVERDSTREG